MDEHDRIGEIAQGDIHYELANIFLAPEKSRAELHTQFLTEKDLHRAHILAFLGDDCGKEVLAEAIAAMDWDKGWNYTGMGQFGMSMSPLDSMLFALAHIGGDKEVILGKLQTLRYEHEFSHIRAICMALVHHPDARAAEKLTSLLRTYGATGHAVRRLRDVFTANREEWNDTECRNFQLKELYLAKALAACDPHNGEAQTVLDAYKNSLNGYYALFAGK